MSPEIYAEVTFFFHSCLIGIFITLIYDGFLIFRRVIPHNYFWVSIEDFFFWFFCAIGVFYLLVKENNGTLRWFAILGAILGMLLYKKSVSAFYINIMSTIWKTFFSFLYKITTYCMKPVLKATNVVLPASKRVLKRSGRYKKYVKKKLTVCIKLLKITLCKQTKKQGAKK